MILIGLLMLVMFIGAPKLVRPVILLPLLIEPRYMLYALGGVSDTVWAFLICLMILSWRNRSLSAVWFGLACALKQQPWMLVPFLAIRLLRDEQQPERAITLARRIKAQVYSDLSPALRCSVGIASTRLLAKTACDLQKPDGLTCLTDNLLPDALAGLSITDIPGISTGISTRLRRAGVLSVTDLWELARGDCRRLWGSVQGEYFWCGLHGVDAAEPPTRRSSMGHAHVLPPVYRNEAGVHALLVRLLCKLGTRLRFHGYFAHQLHATSSAFQDPLQWARDIPLPCVQDTPTLLKHLDRLWSQRPQSGAMCWGGATRRGAKGSSAEESGAEKMGRVEARRVRVTWR
ncbi:MAG: hypothetical protein HC794_06490 [Nitrospiraceae bacterium]|nr:hypothetical protein [Nitrospiraceae bacterium]